MAERKTVYKWFWVWDFEKEERWLNEMALAGWALVSVGWCRYTFEASEPGEYTVRLEMHGYDPEYVDFMAQAKAEYVGRVLQWLYFRKRAEAGGFELFSDIDSRIGHLDRIGRMLSIVGGCNLLIGISVRNPEHAERIGTIDAVEFAGKFDGRDWDELVHVPFEDCELAAPKNYDKLLSIMYGDYMTPPPERARTPHYESEGSVIRDMQRDFREYRSEILRRG